MNSSVSSEISRASIQSIVSPQGAEAMAEVTGQYGGEVVRGSSESEKLADAAEEMGMAVAHRADKKSLNLREIRKGGGANLEALERIAAYYSQLPNFPSDEKIMSLVEELTQYLLNTGSGEGGQEQAVTKDDIFRALQHFDGDVTHQFAALEVVAEYFAGMDSELDAAIADAKRDFEEGELARDVRAGFAVAQLADQAAQKMDTNPAAVRNNYRQMLREAKNMGQLFDDLCAFDHLKNFKEILDIFLEAAGRDLGSSGPSTDPRFLNVLLAELGKLKKIHTVYDNTGQQIGQLARLVGKPDASRISDQYMTSRLLHFCAKANPSMSDAMAMTDGIVGLGVLPLLHVSNMVKALYDDIPDDVLPTPQARENQTRALLSWMTALVEEEEREANAEFVAER